LLKTQGIYNCIITPNARLFDFSKNIESISLLPRCRKI
jgi:hypothetical protein